MKRFPIAFTSAVCTLALAVGSVSGVEARVAHRLEVTLDGQPSDLVTATAHHCHDLRPRRLTCFTSVAARDEDAIVADEKTASAGSMSTGRSTLSTTATGYVIAYVDATYVGASVVLSQDYTNLSTIGWNDRISSYKVYTNLTGAFYSASGFGGVTQFYCCFSQISYVGDAYNDTFSSFNLP